MWGSLPAGPHSHSMVQAGALFQGRDRYRPSILFSNFVWVIYRNVNDSQQETASKRSTYAQDRNLQMYLLLNFENQKHFKGKNTSGRVVLESISDFSGT